MRAAEDENPRSIARIKYPFWIEIVPPDASHSQIAWVTGLSKQMQSSP